MTLKEAIQHHQRMLGRVKLGDPTEQQKAIMLGIESLKRLQETRSQVLPKMFTLLPGETME